MAQFSLNVAKSIGNEIGEWFQANITDFNTSLASTCHSTHLFDIYIWGDVAYRNQDRQITADLLNGLKKCYTGRSWVLINKETRIVYAASDEFGTFPLLVYQHQQLTIIASSRTALINCLEDNVEFNQTALRNLLALGQLFNNDCIIKHTQHFTGESLIKVNLNNHTLEKQKIQAQYVKCLNKTTKYSHAKDAFIEAVRNCFKNDSNPLVSLSGGLDSRAILSACDVLNLKPEGLCYGEVNSTDVQYAIKLANACNLKLFHSKSSTTHFDTQTIKRITQASIGEVPFHHAHALIDNQLLDQTQGRTIITGTGAETYRAFYYDRGMPGFRFFGQSSLNKYTVPRIERYISEELTKQTWPIAQLLLKGSVSMEKTLNDFIKEHICKYVDAAKQADQFYLKARCQRMVVAGQQLLDSYYNRTHPFLNDEVVCTMLNLPAKYKLHSAFHRKLISDLSPKLAALPWDKTHKPLNRGLTFGQKYPGLLSRFGLNGHFGKRSKPMYQYDYSEVSQSVLLATVNLLGLDDKDKAALISQIRQYKLENYIIGFGLVWLNCVDKAQILKAS